MTPARELTSLIGNVQDVVYDAAIFLASSDIGPGTAHDAYYRWVLYSVQKACDLDHAFQACLPDAPSTTVVLVWYPARAKDTTLRVPPITRGDRNGYTHQPGSAGRRGPASHRGVHDSV